MSSTPFTNAGDSSAPNSFASSSLSAKRSMPITCVAPYSLANIAQYSPSPPAPCTGTSVFFSIPFADDDTGRAIETQAPLVSRRFEAMRALSAAGIATGVSIAPIIPGLNDDDIPRILERARDAGATQASYILLRLPGNVRPVFLERLRAALPERAKKVENRLLEVRGGALYNADFFERQHGNGVYWDMIERQWHVHTRRLGFAAHRAVRWINGDNAPARSSEPSPFRRPGQAVQGSLF